MDSGMSNLLGAYVDQRRNMTSKRQAGSKESRELQESAQRRRDEWQYTEG